MESKYSYLIESNPELKLAWRNKRREHVKGCVGNKTQILLYLKCSMCDEYTDSKYGNGWVRWMPNVCNSYLRRGQYICERCRTRFYTKPAGHTSEAHEKQWETKKNTPGYYENSIRPWVDAGHTSEAHEKQIETKKINGSLNKVVNALKSPESQQKAAESNNKNREARGNVWANESKWEQELATKYGGECGLRVYFEYDHKTRWPDIIFSSGHVIQIDDKSHKKKDPLYEWYYDIACYEKYGKRPLHIMMKHSGINPHRERFTNVDELIQAYLRDELYDDEYIMLNDSWYPKDIYYGG